MAVSTSQRHAADEEARAEVEVLNSRLEKTSQLTKKIQASLNRLETSGKSVQDAIGPIYGNTQRLQVLGRNIDGVLGAIEKIRKPSDTKNHEEDIIRAGPDKAGLSAFLGSLKRVNKALADLKASNLKSNQQAAAELSRLLKAGNQQLEQVFETILREDAQPIEPLHYITKAKQFPSIPQDKASRLAQINSFLLSGPRNQDGSDPPTSSIYATVRGPYLTGSLATLNFAAINTAKKKTPSAVYKQGTNATEKYAEAIEGMFMVEYDTICALFAREEWSRVFNITCRNAMSELTRALKELDVHIRAHLTTDCYLAFEIIEIISNLSSRIDSRTGELKPLFATALKPIRDTAKSSLASLLQDTQSQISSLQMLSNDGGPLPVTTETMTRLQTMVDFLRPVSSVMISLGDGNWKTINPSSSSQDIIPSLKSFDVGADGKEIFAHYCNDTIDAMMQSLNLKSQMLLKGKLVQGAFIANNHAVVNRMVMNSDLQPLLGSRMANIDIWRKKGRDLYLKEWDDASRYLFDQINTGRSSQRPPSGNAAAVDSAAILKGLSSKEKDNVKEKFKNFNTTFDDLVSRHKSLNMEREVREMLARSVQSTIEPLYFRFWDRYHEIDKGKGKYVKWDKAEFSKFLMALA